MLDVEIQVACEECDCPDEGQLTRWARAAYAQSGSAEVVLRMVDALESRQLNHQYRGMDKATNVLSFPFEVPADVPNSHLGDLVLCVPVIEQEADEQGKPPTAHWAHMVIHGMLHLQGYDHQNDNEAAHMERREVEILQGLGFADPYNGSTEPPSYHKEQHS